MSRLRCKECGQLLPNREHSHYKNFTTGDWVQFYWKGDLVAGVVAEDPRYLDAYIFPFSNYWNLENMDVRALSAENTPLVIKAVAAEQQSLEDEINMTHQKMRLQKTKDRLTALDGLSNNSKVRQANGTDAKRGDTPNE